MFGTCRYCGQAVMIVADWTEEEKNENAHYYCDCTAAKAERRINEQIQEAYDNIDALFGSGCEVMGYTPREEAAVLDLLKNAAAACARGEIYKAGITISGGDVALINMTGSGTVKVMRRVVHTQSREAGRY